MSYTIGDFTYGNPLVFQWRDTCKLSIGKFCAIADGVRIIVDGTHCIDQVSSYHISQLFPELPNNPRHAEGKGDMVIGNDVWIGMKAIILPGVSIGDGAVIGAGAVVRDNVKPYEIVIGNPARPIKFRFTPEQIEALLKIKWWNWSIHKIRENIPLLENTNIDAFIEKHK